jgi:hypothetical protein
MIILNKESIRHERDKKGMCSTLLRGRQHHSSPWSAGVGCKAGSG